MSEQTNKQTPPPQTHLRAPYDLRLKVGKALDRLVCDDSTPEQVDKFIETFREFGLIISGACSTPLLTQWREGAFETTADEAAQAALDQQAEGLDAAAIIEAWLTAATPSPQSNLRGEPVAWRVRVKSDDQEEWSLLPAGGGADYLDGEGYECQPLYLLAPEGK